MPTSFTRSAALLAFSLASVLSLAAQEAVRPLDQLFAPTAPAAAKSIADAKPLAKPGEKIVIRGRIGGSRSPMVNGRAVFTIVDSSVPTCADHPDDPCKTPWDYCCEPKSVLAAKSATVQVVDANGAILKEGIAGVRGLVPMSELIVDGVVHAADGKSVLVVNTQRLWIARLGDTRFEGTAPAGAKPLGAALPASKEGEEIVVSATVAAKDAFGAKEATVRVVDGAAAAIVLFTDKSKRPVATSVEGMNGLVAGAPIVVAGVRGPLRDGVPTILARQVGS